MSNRATLAFVATLLLTTVLFANVIGQQERPPQEPDIIGKVLDAETSRPLFARITIHGTPEQSFMISIETDDRGYFEALLPTGTLFILVEARGYVSQRKEIQLEEDEQIEMKFLMKELTDTPEPNVFGQMISPDDQVMNGVVAFFKDNRDGIKIDTERDGSFSLHLEPGVYKWVARAEGIDPVDGTVTVPREGEVRLMITMEKPIPDDIRYGMVVGKVVNMEGEPLPGAHVIFMPMMPGYDQDPEAMVRPVPDHFSTETDRSGSFKIRLPFGIYMMEVNAEHHHPVMMDIALSPDGPEVRVMVEMEWFDEEPFRPHNIKVHFDYFDSDSDGNPEKLVISVDINNDDVHDIYLEMIDRNSDGNPESVKFHMDVPMERLMDIMNKVMEQLSYMPQIRPPVPEEPYWDDDMEFPGPDGYPGMEDEGESPIDPEALDRLRELFGIEEETENDEDIIEGSETSAKGSKNAISDDLPAILAAIGVLMIIVSALVIGGYLLRLKKYDY